MARSNWHWFKRDPEVLDGGRGGVVRVMDASELVFWSSSSVAGVPGCDRLRLVAVAVAEQGDFCCRARCGCSMHWRGRLPLAWSRVCCNTSLPALCPCMCV